MDNFLAATHVAVSQVNLILQSIDCTKASQQDFAGLSHDETMNALAEIGTQVHQAIATIDALRTHPR